MPTSISLTFQAFSRLVSLNGEHPLVPSTVAFSTLSNPLFSSRLWALSQDSRPGPLGLHLLDLRGLQPRLLGLFGLAFPVLLLYVRAQ